MHLRLAGFLAALFCALAPSPALSRPLHGLRTAEACATCHVSPGGGGLRTAFGRRWAGAELPTFSLLEPAPPRRALRPDWVSVGTDVVFAVDAPATDLEPAADLRGTLSAAVRPYNPVGDREGRVTLVVVPALNLDGEDVQLREYSVVFDDLMLDLALQAGRFVAPFGERFPTPGLAERFDAASAPREAPLTGAALHVRPGDLVFSLAAGRPDTAWDAPLAADAGWETNSTLAWQPQAGRLGVSAALAGGTPGRRARYALHGGLDLDRLLGVPLTALGEYDLDHGTGTSGDGTVGLRAQYLLAWQMARGLDLSGGYAWRDRDTVVRYDSQHALHGELRWDAVSYVGLRLRYEHLWRYDAERFDAGRDTVTLAFHGGF